MRKYFKKIIGIIISITIFLNLPITTNAVITNPESNNSNVLTEVESLIGHYQFNITAGSNINSKGDRGYSHVDSMAAYEKDHSSKLLGNSSGGYLDGSYNEDGSIYKAYLIIETSTVDYSLPDYPITFVSGTTNNKLETKVEYYCFDSTYSSGNERRAGYIDVTDFVKKNGYGWYYVCNIPYSSDGASLESDQFAGWKLIVIEENLSIPMRILKLKIGAQNISGAGSAVSIDINRDGIRTVRSGTVSGQLLFGVSGADPSTSGQNNSITYTCDNSIIDGSTQQWKTFTTKTEIRTKENPLCFISSRNGTPLQEESNFENSVYFYNGEFSTTNVNGSYRTGSGDLELLDISQTSNFYHDVKFENDKRNISCKFETTANCSLMISTLGICVDIDVPVYDNDYTITYDKENEKFLVSGVLSNITDLYDIGLSNALFNFEYDDSLEIVEYDAKITSILSDDSGKYEATLLGSDIVLDRTNHIISFNINGISKEERNTKNLKNDVLYYNIALEPKNVKDYYDNTIYISGIFFSDDKDTKLFFDKIAAENITNSLDGIITKRSLVGKIIWEDNSDEKNVRPTKIKVSLCMDSVPIDTLEVTGRGNIWEYKFEDLNIYKTLDYVYDYEALIKDEYENYDIIYSETSNNITFRIKEKYIPDNNIVKNASNAMENIVSDITLTNIGFNTLLDCYGISCAIDYKYRDIMKNN